MMADDQQLAEFAALNYCSEKGGRRCQRSCLRMQTQNSSAGASWCT